MAGSDQRITDAARRVADEVLRRATEAGLEAHSKAILNGRSGGSRTLLFLARLVEDAFQELATSVRQKIVNFAGHNASDYRSDYLVILDENIPRMIDVFRDNGGHAPSFGRTSEREEADLLKALGALRDAEMNEFDLEVLVTEKGAGVGEVELELALLQVYSRTDKAHKINVIGRPFQSGALELQMGITFDDKTRAMAGRAVGNLVDRELLQPTYSDISQPEAWLRITDAGKEAMRTGALDPLDGALTAIDPRFVVMRRGARNASLSVSPDSWRQAAQSARELLGQVLHALAPEKEVRAQPGFSAEKITRKSRVRVAMRKRPRGFSETDLEVVEAAADLIDALCDKLNAVAHSRDQDGNAVFLVKSVDLVLELLLL